MLQKLARLRGSSKSVRDRYALGIASSFTIIVALIWVVTLPARFGQTPMENAQATGAAPFASLFKQARDQVAAVKNANEVSDTSTAKKTTVVTEAIATPPLDPNSITLTPEDITAAESRAAVEYNASSTGRVVQIITTSALASSSQGTSSTRTQR